MHRRFALAFVLAAIAALGAACGGVADPSKNQVETFSGRIELLGVGGPHTFTVAKTGEFTATIASLSPGFAGVIGIIYGINQSNGTCGLIQQNQFASVGRPGLGGPIGPGSYCVAIFDYGTLSVAEDYTLTVSHP